MFVTCFFDFLFQTSSQLKSIVIFNFALSINLLAFKNKIQNLILIFGNWQFAYVLQAARVPQMRIAIFTHPQGISRGNDQEVEFHEIEIHFFMRSKLFLILRLNFFSLFMRSKFLIMNILQKRSGDRIALGGHYFRLFSLT